jgi:hypothetical protein
VEQTRKRVEKYFKTHSQRCITGLGTLETHGWGNPDFGVEARHVRWLKKRWFRPKIIEYIIPTHLKLMEEPPLSDVGLWFWDKTVWDFVTWDVEEWLNGIKPC